MTIVRKLLAVVLLALPLGVTLAAASKLDQRKSDEGGVLVAVTPKVVDASAEAWEFSVSIDTHTKALDTDMAAASELIAGETAYPAVSWAGDKPGGHHRSGVLRFAKPAGAPKQIEIRIKSVGGIASRSFSWTLP